MAEIRGDDATMKTSGDGEKRRSDETESICDFDRSTALFRSPRHHFKAVRNLAGNETAYEYWENDLLKSITDPLGNKASFFYDAKGNLTRRENPNGTTVEFDYTETNLVRTQVCRNSAGEIAFSYGFSYTSAGGVCEVADNLGRRLSYSYSLDGRLIGSVDTNNPAMIGGFEIARISKGGGKSDVIELRGGETRTYERNKDAKLTTLLLSSEQERRVVLYCHEEGGRKVEMTIPGGVTKRYTYDEAGRIASIESIAADASRSYTYAYDAKGNMLSENNARFTYDALDRLIAWYDPLSKTTTTYSYDSAGNLLSMAEGGSILKSLSYDAAHRIASDGFSYDANGNLTGNERDLYSYDPLNRLSQVVREGRVIASYEYDYLGRRTRSTQGGKSVFYHYDGVNLIAESDETGAVIAGYAHDDAGQLVSMTREGRTYFYQFNSRGDVVSLSDCDGHVVNRYTYDPWGKIIAADEQVENPYRYAGYRYDEVTGLYYLFQRYYHPETARFLSKDALFDTLVRGTISHNAYTYAFNNPTTCVDPYGAWGSRIHKDVTEGCAKQLGYETDEVEAIVKATVDTDTVPGNCYSDAPGRHINKHWLGWLGVRLPDQLKYANEELALAKELQSTDKAQSLQHLGEGLHSLQDYFAHGTLPPYGWHTFGPWNGLMPWYSADDPDSILNRRRARKTAEATTEYLKEYLADEQLPS